MQRAQNAMRAIGLSLSLMSWHCGGAGEPPEGDSGVACSDGQRDGFVDATAFPDVAGCAGGWSVPGVSVSMPRLCEVSGDDSDNLRGQGCHAGDLCGTGWHLCVSHDEVARLAVDCSGAAVGLDEGEPVFFVQQRSGSGGGACNGRGADEIFGCGTMGGPAPGCAPLAGGGEACGSLAAPWSCPPGPYEANSVVKGGPALGGALCCRDGAFVPPSN